VDELAEGVVGVAETLGGILLGQAVDEDGAEGFVLSLGWTGGLAEEELAEGIVHVRCSRCEVMLAGNGLYASRSPIRLPGENRGKHRLGRLENKGKARCKRRAEGSRDRNKKC
jgi:hypothetical protein